MSFNFQFDDSKENSKFSRSGNTVSRRYTKKPAWYDNTAKNLIKSSDISPGLETQENAAIGALMTKDYAGLPSMDKLMELISLDPNSFTGSGTLGAIADINPYSDVYKEGVEGLYQDIFAEAGANARTGPLATRGGANHGAMVEANVLEKAALDKFREITGLQMGQAGLSMQAGQTLESLAGARRDDSLGASATLLDTYLKGLGIESNAIDLLNRKRVAGGGLFPAVGRDVGSEVAGTQEQVFGRGSTISSHTGWGAGNTSLCCMIYMEAIEGPLPWFVRRARDVFGTPEMRNGYIRMSKWIIPFMRRWKLIHNLVKYAMIVPLKVHGAWFFNAEGNRPWLGRAFTPLRKFWFSVWTHLGKEK